MQGLGLRVKGLGLGFRVLEFRVRVPLRWNTGSMEILS